MSVEMKSILAAGRAAMLLEPVAEEFNSLLMQPPVRRVLCVAEVLAGVARKNDTVAQIIDRDNVMGALRDQGRSRGAGGIVVPQAFTPDFDRQFAREAGNA